MSNEDQAILPPELEEMIFSLCFQNDWKTCTTLTLVAKRVYQWLIPQIYRVAIFHSGERCSNPPTPGSRFPSQNLEHHGEYVRHIMFHNSAGNDLTGLYNLPGTCLSWCPNVVNVALWTTNDQYDGTLIHQLLRLHITHLSLDIGTLLSHIGTTIGGASVSFTWVTHLEIISKPLTTQPEEIENLFPALTHLALNGSGRNKIEIVRDFLDCWEDKLEVLVWYRGVSSAPVPEVIPTAKYLSLDDPRVVVLWYGQLYLETWTAGVEGGLGIWRTADETVKKRRRGLVAS
ncbi:hypothetical protein BDN72DRAFT_965377 [Pluteus cervinus]|uniref:Uncharacterized protein n=1 Tax=Pluteus cervinus TaxID=181527 RepID=A0ACD3A5T5_9AGAR|nr:hypothetical protein BDN72DRAFT_965377 [Pluteus cervinus]